MLKKAQANTKKNPLCFVKIILRRTQNNPDNKHTFFCILEPMTPQEWCMIWIPLMHPGVEIPYNGERNPYGYIKACSATLSALTGYNHKTV